MKKLNKTDAEKYLCPGNLSKPFLSDDFVLSKVLIDYNFKLEKNIKTTKIESLYNWIAKNVKLGDKEFNEKNRFMLTAAEVWENKLSTGCTDYATLFATFARQIGIPTTILHTAELGYIQKLQNNEKLIPHKGHTFCECFYEGKWILVDPTYKKIELNYNPNKLELSYKVGDSSIFIPYFRGLDLEKKQTTKMQNHEMDRICKTIKI